MSYGLPGFTQDAARAAIEQAKDVPRLVARELVERRRIVADALSAVPGVSIFSGGGGMFLIMDIRTLRVGATEFARGLLDSEGVSVQPLTGFGESCAGLIRVSAVLTEERLKQACARIARYVDSLE